MYYIYIILILYILPNTTYFITLYRFLPKKSTSWKLPLTQPNNLDNTIYIEICYVHFATYQSEKEIYPWGVKAEPVA